MQTDPKFDIAHLDHVAYRALSPEALARHVAAIEAADFEVIGWVEGRFHHVTCTTDQREDTLRGADIFPENGVFIETGPHEGLVYNMTRALAENQVTRGESFGAFRNAHRETMSPRNQMPYHPGAVRDYEQAGIPTNQQGKMAPRWGFQRGATSHTGKDIRCLPI